MGAEQTPFPDPGYLSLRLAWPRSPQRVAADRERRPVTSTLPAPFAWELGLGARDSGLGIRVPEFVPRPLHASGSTAHQSIAPHADCSRDLEAPTPQRSPPL